MLYLFFVEMLNHYGLALIVLSLLTSLIIHPFMKWAAKLQNEEKHLQDVMIPQVDTIKAESKGAEQYQRIQRLYKRYGYHPVMAIRSAVGVMLQIPFLMAAFYMLSKLPDIQGVPWGFIRDLGKPDGLLGGFNVLPFVMTAVNLLGAYTTKGFSKRDRLQAVVIAVLFLVLLYTAPSALLIYWICNNLWTLLGNVKVMIIEKFGIAAPHINIKGKSLSTWISNMPNALYVCLALALTVSVFVPTDIYLTNSGELWFSFSHIFYYLFLALISIFIVLSIFYFAICKLGMKLPLLIYIVFLLGSLIGVFLQSYIINLDYGILDGHSIPWESLRKEAILNNLAWSLCYIIPFVVSKKLTESRFQVFIRKISCFLIVVQLISLIFSVTNYSGEQRYHNLLTTEKQFEFSRKNNIIVFVLDSFSANMFEEIRKKNPEVLKDFKGFTFYPDAVSLYGGTDYSLPQMITGAAFDNTESYSSYVKHAYEKSYYSILKKKNYDIRLFTFSSFVSNIPQIIDNLKKADFVVQKDTLNSYKNLVLFRILPHIFKKNHVIYSGDLRSPKAANQKLKAYKEDDVLFYRELKKGIKVINKKNCFRFYHLNGTHAPYTMDENVKRLSKGKSTSKYNQGVGSLKIVAECIRQMKKLRIFNNSTFLVLADHGIYNRIASSPLVMVKQPGEKIDILKVSENPVTYKNLHATIFKRLLGNNSVYGHPFNIKLNEKRLFYQMFLSKGGILDIKEYWVNGYAGDLNSWKEGKTIKPEYIGENTYIMNDKIEFTTVGNSIKYTDSGWDRPFADHTFTNGAESICRFNIKDFKKGKDLVLRVWASAYLIDKAKSRNYDIYVNNKKIASWDVDKKDLYQCIIPNDVIGNATITIQLKLKNPVANNFYAYSRGLAVYALQITYR